MNAQDITQECISTLYIIQYIYIHELYNTFNIYIIYLYIIYMNAQDITQQCIST